MVPGAETGAPAAAVEKTQKGYSTMINLISLIRKKELKQKKQAKEFAKYSPLHWRGTPGMLQARGSEMARVRLMGTWNGLPVAIWHIHSVPLLEMVWRALQQAGVGGAPAALLLVTKAMQGAKLVIMEGEQGELIWAYIGITKANEAIARS